MSAGAERRRIVGASVSFLLLIQMIVVPWRVPIQVAGTEGTEEEAAVRQEMAVRYAPIFAPPARDEALTLDPDDPFSVRTTRMFAGRLLLQFLFTLGLGLSALFVWNRRAALS